MVTQLTPNWSKWKPTANEMARLRASVVRDSLSAFVKAFWCVLEPGADLHWGWHLDAICEHLEAVARGDIRQLLINIPPRHLKSTIVSQMFPAWVWLREPSKRFLTGSYALSLALRDATRARDVIESKPYLELLAGGWSLKSDQNQKSRYENTKTGTRFCTAVDAGATGEGGNFVIVDDPHNVKNVDSNTSLESVKSWLDKTLSSRLNNPKKDCRIMVMQRVHHDDASAHVLGKKWEHLCLSTMYESDHPTRSRTSLHFSDPRKVEGELLCPEQFGVEEVEQAQLDMGAIVFAGQHQQRPSPREGTIYKADQFRVWDIEPPKFDLVLFSADLAFKGAEDNKGIRAQKKAITDPSHVNIDLWGFVGSKCYLLDQINGQWDFARTLENFVLFCHKHPYVFKKLIEDKANGPALESVIKDEVVGIEMVEPRGGKYQRAIAIQPLAQAGNIYIPNKRHYPWVDKWIEEVCAFPMHRHNDRVDTMSQAILHVHGKGSASARDRLKILERLQLLAKGDL